MEKIVALIDVDTLKKEGKQAPQWLEQIEARGIKIMLISPWQKTPKTEAWLKETGFAHQQSVFNDTAPTTALAKKFYNFKGTPTKWKVFLITSLLKSFDTGTSDPCDLILFVDDDMAAYASATIILDPRVLPCESLEKATTIELAPRTIQQPQQAFFQ